MTTIFTEQDEVGDTLDLISLSDNKPMSFRSIAFTINSRDGYEQSVDLSRSQIFAMKEALQGWLHGETGT